MKAVLQISHLSKRLGNREVLSDLSFDTYAGEVFGFLGPNGAGKTTTIKILAGLLTLDQGDVSIAGYDMRRQFECAMDQLGAIVENPEFYKYLTGYENLLQYANMRSGVTEERIREVTHLVGLDNRIHEKVGRYSLGMRQRLGVAQAILHRPKLLVLDEPTNGLDPAGIKDLRDILKDLAHKENCAVLVSSHLMSEMELMCDRVGVIADGKLQSVQSMSELIAASDSGHEEFLIKVSDSRFAAELLGAEDPTVRILTPDAWTLDLTLPKEGALKHLSEINKRLVNGGLLLYTVSQKENKKLEDVFIELTGKRGDQID